MPPPLNSDASARVHHHSRHPSSGRPQPHPLIRRERDHNNRRNDHVEQNMPFIRQQASNRKMFPEKRDAHRSKLLQAGSQESNQSSKQRAGGFCRTCLNVFLWVCLFNLLLSVIIYFAPMEEPQIEPKIAAHRPRPEFVGPLAMNERLDDAELLFANQFHAPESFAWRRSTNQTFFTTVEGGFIIEVNPWTRDWHTAARLNSPNSDVRDESDQVAFIQGSKVQLSPQSPRTMRYCERDVELYGEEAKTLPRAVPLSRCSRPLGIRLSPDESYLYVVDPLSGLFRINLTATAAAAAATTTRLINFAKLDVRFADDLAVKWGATPGEGDKIYISDCSRRWTLRYLIRMMIENDDTGRILEYSTQRRELRPLASASQQDGSLRPVKIRPSIHNSDAGESGKEEEDDWRNLSFPNGVELTANGSALLVSDLNNRRILMHHLEGPLRGQTRHLLWVPGYSDNIKRGLDSVLNGRATYWLACGCAVSDGSFEIAEFSNQLPVARKFLLKLMHYVGSSIEWLGARSFVKSSSLQNAGFELKSMWLKKDPYCTHGLVMQFDETGRVLRTLHAPHFSSYFKIVSEAHEVPDPEAQPSSISHLFIGSVYYSYLGHLELKML